MKKLDNDTLLVTALNILGQIDRDRLSERNRDRLASAEMKLAIIEDEGNADLLEREAQAH